MHCVSLINPEQFHVPTTQSNKFRKRHKLLLSMRDSSIIKLVHWHLIIECVSEILSIITPVHFQWKNACCMRQHMIFTMRTKHWHCSCLSSHFLHWAGTSLVPSGGWSLKQSNTSYELFFYWIQNQNGWGVVVAYCVCVVVWYNQHMAPLNHLIVSK